MVILFTLFFTFFIFPEFWYLLYQYREKYGCFVHFHFPKTFLLSSMYTLFFLFSSVASIWLFFLLSSLIYMFFRFSPAPPIYFVLFSICFPHSTAACLQYHESKPPLFCLLPYIYVFGIFPCPLFISFSFPFAFPTAQRLSAIPQKHTTTFLPSSLCIRFLLRFSASFLLHVLF